MGGRRRFKDLPGTKLITFDQSRHQDWYQAYGGPAARDGVCATLTMAWLQAKLSKKSFGMKKNEDKSNKQQVLDTNKDLTINAASYFPTYSSIMTSGKANFQSKINEAARHYNLAMSAQKECQFDKLYSQIYAFIHTHTPPYGIFLQIIVEQRENPYGQHAVGLYASGQDLEFFDPNGGAWSIKKTALNDFLEEWASAYHTRQWWPPTEVETGKGNMSMEKCTFLLVKQAS